MPEIRKMVPNARWVLIGTMGFDDDNEKTGNVSFFLELSAFN